MLLPTKTIILFISIEFDIHSATSIKNRVVIFNGMNQNKVLLNRRMCSRSIKFINFLHPKHSRNVCSIFTFFWEKFPYHDDVLLMNFHHNNTIFDDKLRHFMEKQPNAVKHAMFTAMSFLGHCFQQQVLPIIPTSGQKGQVLKLQTVKHLICHGLPQ